MWLAHCWAERGEGESPATTSGGRRKDPSSRSSNATTTSSRCSSEPEGYAPRPADERRRCVYSPDAVRRPGPTVPVERLQISPLPHDREPSGTASTLRELLRVISRKSMAQRCHVAADLAADPHRPRQKEYALNCIATASPKAQRHELTATAVRPHSDDLHQLRRTAAVRPSREPPSAGTTTTPGRTSLAVTSRSPKSPADTGRLPYQPQQTPHACPHRLSREPAHHDTPHRIVTRYGVPMTIGRSSSQFSASMMPFSASIRTTVPRTMFPGSP